MTDQPILWWLAHNTLFAAILATGVYLACRLFRLRPAVRHVLWLVVLIKLVTPPLINWPWAADWPKVFAPSPSFKERSQDFPPDHHRFALTSGQSRGQVAGEPADGLLPRDVGPDHEEFLIVPGNSWQPDAAVQWEPATPPASPLLNWQSAKLWTWGLMSFWAAAGLGMVTLQALRVYRFRRRVAKARSASGPLVDQVNELAKQLGLPAPRTLIAPDIASPMVWGLGRPTLLWPASLLDQLSPTCQQAVIVHELAHLRRRDHWVGWLQLVAGCVWWWHPLYRYVSRQVRANAELACDAWVVNLMPSARRAYADALLEVSHLLSRNIEPAPVLGMAAGRLELERRLVMIMRDSASCKLSLRSLLILGAVALITLPGWSLSQQAGDPADEEPAVEEQKEMEKDGVYDIEFKLDELDLSAMELEDEPGSDKGKDVDRLDRLERQLQALLKEVKALRAAKKQGAPSKPAKDLPTAEFEKVYQWQSWNAKPQDVQDVYVWQNGWNVQADQGDDKPIILSRATYKMPRAKADALASFLRDQLKEQSLETKVEDDAIVITALPEVQKTISQFIGLVQGKTFAFEIKGAEKPAQK
jgi:beta-lactamase regulating signal transducer with metallopeptidase domain